MSFLALTVNDPLPPGRAPFQVSGLKNQASDVGDMMSNGLEQVTEATHAVNALLAGGRVWHMGWTSNFLSGTHVVSYRCLTNICDVIVLTGRKGT